VATVTVKGESGKTWQFDDKVIGQGGMKDVYFALDKSYVVGFFRDKVDAVGQQRLKNIVGRYRQGLLDGTGGNYWALRFCWPMDVVTHNGRVGVVSPTYPRNFFFSHGSIQNDFNNIKGREKEGKWFTSPKLRARLLPEEKGTWRNYLTLTLNLSRAVRRMHAAGLAHSDLSYKNVLVDPATGKACIIDIDGLVVPGIFPPDVVGTPDFIAPEVVATKHLKFDDPNRKLPSQATDRHALAVLIYMYLLYRHPLKGGKIHDLDPAKDEDLLMGKNALFIEHPTDKANRVKVSDLAQEEEIWGNPNVMPYTVTGPYLSDLFKRAFVDGLQNPASRPIAAEWEHALLKTVDMIQPCSNKQCEMGWYVFDNKTVPTCPFCKTPYSGKLPVLDLYRAQVAGRFLPENHRIMVWDGQSLYPWHVNFKIIPNENLKEADSKRVGYFQIISGDWYLVNERMLTLEDVTEKANVKNIAVGEKVKLQQGTLLKLSSADDGRLVSVSMAGQ
jgi:serine/threonine protein kinase